MRIVKRLGFAIPRDIAIVGFTNGQISALTDPQLSSVEQFGYDMGKRAVQMLINRLKSKEHYPSQKQVIQTKLIVKGSSSRNL